MIDLLQTQIRTRFYTRHTQLHARPLRATSLRRNNNSEQTIDSVGPNERLSPDHTLRLRLTVVTCAHSGAFCTVTLHHAECRQTRRSRRRIITRESPSRLMKSRVTDAAVTRPPRIAVANPGSCRCSGSCSCSSSMLNCSQFLIIHPVKS
jgi:hypothetical protein